MSGLWVLSPSEDDVQTAETAKAPTRDPLLVKFTCDRCQRSVMALPELTRHFSWCYTCSGDKDTKRPRTEPFSPALGTFSTDVSLVQQCASPLSQCSLESGFARQYKGTDLLTDCTIVVENAGHGSREFHLHNAILSSSSLYFRALFNGNMLEGRSRSVTVTDMCPETMHMLLVSIYLPGRLQVFLSAWHDSFVQAMAEVRTQTSPAVFFHKASLSKSLFTPDYRLAWHRFLNCGAAVHFRTMSGEDCKDEPGSPSSSKPVAVSAVCLTHRLLEKVGDLWAAADSRQLSQVSAECQSFYLKTMFRSDHLFRLMTMKEEVWNNYLEEIMEKEKLTEAPQSGLAEVFNDPVKLGMFVCLLDSGNSLSSSTTATSEGGRYSNNCTTVLLTALHRVLLYTARSFSKDAFIVYTSLNNYIRKLPEEFVKDCHLTSSSRDSTSVQQHLHAIKESTDLPLAK